MYDAGEVVAGFTIEEYLGGGSSADVFRAHRDGAPGPVALKVLRPDTSDRRHTRERFLREFEIARALDHPHIVAMLDRGEIGPDHNDAFIDIQVQRPVDERPEKPELWLAMPYIAGPAATALIPSETEEPEMAAVLRLATQIADALDYAHDHDVLHRDVKPANILLSRPVGPEASGDPVDAYLTDFGIAQFVDDRRPLARNGRVQGSIAYAAPELLQAHRITPATDQYAFACSLVELFTGAAPYPRDSAFAITQAHLHALPPKLTRRRPWLPSALDSVFAKALAKTPEDRYPRCADFVGIVTRVMRDVPVPQTKARRFGWPMRRAR